MHAREVAEGRGKFTDGAACMEGSGRFEKTAAAACGEARLAQTIALNPAETRFGSERFQFQPENEDGTPDTQAGSHPFQLTSTLNLNQTVESDGFELDPAAPGCYETSRSACHPDCWGTPRPSSNARTWTSQRSARTTKTPARPALRSAQPYTTGSRPRRLPGTPNRHRPCLRPGTRPRRAREIRL